MEIQKLPKNKDNFSLDREASEFIRNHPQEYRSASEFLNFIILKEMKSKKDLYSELKISQSKIKEEQEKEKSFLKEIEKIAEEGDKAEKEKAKKILEEEKAKEEEIKKEMERLTNLLKGKKIFDELMFCNYIDDLLILNRKLYNQNIKISENEILPGFGINLLQVIAAYNGKKIFLHKSDEEENGNK